MKQIISDILNSEDAELKILESFERWNTDYNEKTIFLQLFADIAEKPEEKKPAAPAMPQEDMY